MFVVQDDVILPTSVEDDAALAVVNDSTPDEFHAWSDDGDRGDGLGVGGNTLNVVVVVPVVVVVVVVFVVVVVVVVEGVVFILTTHTF